MPSLSKVKPSQLETCLEESFAYCIEHVGCLGRFDGSHHDLECGFHNNRRHFLNDLAGRGGGYVGGCGHGYALHHRGCAVGETIAIVRHTFRSNVGIAGGLFAVVYYSNDRESRPARTDVLEECVVKQKGYIYFGLIG